MSYERNIIVVALAIAMVVVSCVSTNEETQKYGYWVDTRKSKVAIWQCINKDFLKSQVEKLQTDVEDLKDKVRQNGTDY